MANRYFLPNFTIVLVGKTGSGKSATGNTLLQTRAFQTSVSTSICQKETAEFEGPTLAVVDTPDLFDTRKSENQRKKQINDCVILSAPGPHVFLVVIQANKFTEEEKKYVAHIQSWFGEDAALNTMVLFTHGDDLEADGVSIERIIDKSPCLTAIIHQCGERYHVFNNRNQDPSQVRELLQKVSRMAQNGLYTNEMFQQAERAIKEEIEKIQREIPGVDPQQARKTAERHCCDTHRGAPWGYKQRENNIERCCMVASGVIVAGIFIFKIKILL